jgi:hypothetical protein
MIILLSNNSNIMNDYLDYARELLIHFIKQFELIYVKHLIIDTYSLFIM